MVAGAEMIAFETVQKTSSLLDHLESSSPAGPAPSPLCCANSLALKLNVGFPMTMTGRMTR